MAKRKYTKRSEYWSKFKDSTPNHNLEDITKQSLAEEFSPELVGESFFMKPLHLAFLNQQSVLAQEPIVLPKAILKTDLKISTMGFFHLITLVTL